MAIEFDCPACEATIRVKDEAAGKKGRCPKCKALLLIPDPGPPEVDELEGLPDPEPVDSAISELPPPVPPSPPIAPPVQASATPETLAAPPEPMSLADIQIRADVTDPGIPSTAVASRRLRGKKRHKPISTAKIASFVAAALGFVLLIVGGWFLFSISTPDLRGEIAGEQLVTVALSSVEIPPPAERVPAEDVEKVLADLRRSELPLKSEYVVVTLGANQGNITVDVAPGPRSVAVRLPIGRIPAVEAVLKQKRNEIVNIKQQELSSATANFFTDFAAFLTTKSPMTRLPEYRNQVALNATVGPVGYAIEAVVSNTPFPCVYEDADGYCYFFPPENVRSFRLRGRKLSNGTTPLPVDFEVKIGPAMPQPASSAVETTEPEPEPAEKASEPGGEAEAADETVEGAEKNEPEMPEE